MRIKKILSTDTATQIVWEEKIETGWIEKSEKSPDPVEPKFLQALESLKPDYLNLLEEQTTDPEMWTITGIECSYKSEFQTMNVIITGYKEFKSSNGHKNLKAPNKAAYNNAGVSSAEENLLPDGCFERVEKLIKAAMEYIERDYSEVQTKFDPPERDVDPDQTDLDDE